MTELGLIHVVFTAVAIAAGAAVVLMRKGTRWHRSIGHLYATSMAGVVASALFLFERNGRFGPFHFAAVVAGVTLGAGLYSVLARRPRRSWMEAHATWMSWSYIGLLAALAAESSTRWLMPAVQPHLEGTALLGVFWGAVVAATLAVVAVGAYVVKARLPRSLRATPEAIRAERRRLASTDTTGVTTTSGGS